MLMTLLLLPLVSGLLALALGSARVRRLLFLAASGIHLAVSLASWAVDVPGLGASGWIQLDVLGRLFLTVTSTLFFGVAVQAVRYLQAEDEPRLSMISFGKFAFTKVPEAIFIACLLFLLSALTLVTMAQHFGLLWVAVEATTLVSAPLIYFHRDRRSLEATWKYLVVCSVGIAIALLGNFFLAVSASAIDGSAPNLVVSELTSLGPRVHESWLKAAMILFVVGYGTKMGLAPMHTWLPDAHSQAPSVVSALLSGAVLNGAFVAILRGVQVCSAANLLEFAQSLMLVLGLGSMATAAVFVVRQPDFKRMLAYSSVEHVGILAVGIGLGGGGVFAALLHAINHSVLKGALFLVAGHLVAKFSSTQVAAVRGLLRAHRLLGVCWIGGFLGLAGLPPFGMFITELMIAKASVDAGQYVVLVVFLLLLSIVFIGMAASVLGMVQGESEIVENPRTPSWWALVPAMMLGLISIGLGTYVPVPVTEAIRAASAFLGGEG